MLLLSAGCRHLAAAALVLAGTSLNGPIAYAQNAPSAAAATLRLEGLVATPRTLSAAEIAALPHREQATTDKDGKKHVYRGVALRDVLHLAGAPEGKAIHGPVLAEAVLASAADGYQAVFALPEIDADFSPQTILLADLRDGQPLPAHDGPYQLIVPLEKKPARWVRQVTALRVVKVQ
ncbi:molybdopterin-dependent oxidoreductase [Hymenobacter cheonanensis]|uniref:molybdopterin-dependent oxidoreductase n=1 Tax=Hymenobacter sp. CA2-7 TaxID=3063993 RepID=UPI002714253B|nr:molybdopterin-dependent oxidoreductase [Hymenobacter sp. CA2-7]MDO7886194.1 molybdopterin-dependent oxidoreductase [Hymenobacter sp. CA2-7]